MGVFNNFPYTNFHELNLDWIIEQVRKVIDEWNQYKTDMDLWKAGVDEQLETFQEWFDNLDVLDEVRTIINELIQSGEFIEVTGPQIVSATEAWLAEHITPTTPAVDSSLTIAGAAADAKAAGDKITDVKEDLDLLSDAAADFSRAAKELAANGYTFYDFGDYTTNSILKSDSGNIIPGSGRWNNFAWGKYIPIPNDIIYFSMKQGYKSWVVFYDADRNVVDGMSSDSEGYNILSGRSYDNTSGAAKYMRIGAYRSGGPTGREYCYAYSYNPISAKNIDNVVPLYTNKKSEQPSTVRVYTDYIYADKPLLITPIDSTEIVYGAILYDKNKTSLYTYYVGQMGTKKLSIPSGYYVRIYADRVDNTQQIDPIDAMNYISIEKRKNNLGNVLLASESIVISASNARIGNVDIEYTKVPLLLEYDVNLFTLTVALYPNAGYAGHIMYNYKRARASKIYIPGGSYYRLSFGYSDNREITTDQIESVMKNLKITEIPLVPEQSEAAYAYAGRTRQQFDDEAMPEYYESYMESKVSDIQALQDSSVIQLAYLTDYHYGTYNNTHTVRSLLTKLAKDTNIAAVFNGGDTWTSGSTPQTFGTAKQRCANGIMETTPNAPCDWFFILGNHDTGLDYTGSGGDQVTYGPYLTTQQLSDIVGSTATGKQVFFDPLSYNFAYYYDVNNVRIIVTNPGRTQDGADEGQTNMMVFLIEALLSAGNKTVLLFTHQYYESRSLEPLWGAEKMGEIIVAYNARSTISIDDTLKADFANCEGEVACWISGHKHQDLSTELSDGTPVVVTTTCNAGAELGGLTRTPGTYTENAFDVVSLDTTNKIVYFTRIGAGSDRQFNY